MSDDKDSFVFSILVIGYIYIVWVQIVKVYFFAALLTYARGEHHVGPRFFYVVDEGADALDVGRVGHDSSRYAGELLHAFEEIIAGMIPDFVEPFAVRVRNLGDMRGINNQCSAIGEYRFKFVHDLARGPDIVVHFRGDAENRVVGPVLVRDMNLLGQIRGLFPCFERVSDEDALECIFQRDDGEQLVRHRNKRRRFFYDLSRRRPFAAVYQGVGYNGAKPVEKVDDIVAGDTGENVLVPAGEAYDLMRKHRA